MGKQKVKNRLILRMAGASLIALLLTILVSVVGDTSFGKELNKYCLSLFYAARGPISPPDDVVVVGIDDATFQATSYSARHPYPWLKIAKALQYVKAEKPRLTILTVFIPAPLGGEEVWAELRKALSTGPTVLLLGDDFLKGAEEEDVKRVEQLFSETNTTLLPVKLRREGGVYDSLSLFPDSSLSASKRTPHLKALSLLEDPVGEEPGAEDLINFYGGPGAIRNESLYHYMPLEKKMDDTKPTSLRDKVVVLGFRSLLKERGHSQKEVFPIPASDYEVFGVEIHATILGNLLQGNWLHVPEYGASLLFVLFFICSLAWAYLKPIHSFFFLVTTSLLVTVGSYVLFLSNHIYLSALVYFAPLIVVVLAILAVSHWHTASSSLDKAEKDLGSDLKHLG